MTKHDQKKAAFVFDKVKHCYNGVPALEKIDLKINEGEQIAIVGPVSYTHLTLPTNREV